MDLTEFWSRSSHLDGTVWGDEAVLELLLQSEKLVVREVLFAVGDEHNKASRLPELCTSAEQTNSSEVYLDRM